MNTPIRLPLLLAVLLLVKSYAYPQRQPTIKGGVQFTFKTDGPIRSTPLISGDLLLFGSGDKKIYAISKTTGKKYWDFETDGFVFSSPTVSDGIIFFTSRDNYIYALKEESGKLVWKFKFGELLDNKNYWDYYLGSPIADGNIVYVGAGDGFLYAFEGRTGKIKWKYNAGSRIRRSLAVGDTKIVFGTQKGQVIALDKAGKEKWVFSTDGVKIPFQKNGIDNTSIYTIPVIKDGYVSIAGRDFILYLLDLETGKEIWRYGHPNSWVLGTAIHEGKVFGGSGVATFVHANDLKTGNLLWKFKTNSPVYSSFTFANGLMYFGDMLTGNIYGLDPQTGKQKWLFPMGYQTFSTPVVSDGIVYCSSEEGTMYAVHTIKGDDDRFINAKRIVYYEGNLSDSAFHFFNIGVDTWVRDYLKRLGYESMNTEQLTAYMNSKLSDASRSVIVFADNKIPRAAIEDESENALIRKYLNAGGKVVFFTTVNPLFIVTDPKSGVIRNNLNYQRGTKVFGINFIDQEYMSGFHHSPYTDEGKKWGLRGYTRGYWPVEPKEVTTVLALDEHGKTSCWNKNYGGPEGSGLLTFSFIPTNVLGADFFPMRAAIEYGISW